MRIVLVGGGTGGHFYPLIAVAEVLRRESNQDELFYIGPTPYSQSDLDRLSIRFAYCPAGKMRTYFSIQNFFDIFRTIAGIVVALVKLYIIYPDVVFSKGGYTSVPVILAARFLRIPVVVHDSDAVPGRATLLAKNFARYIALSYPEATSYFTGKTNVAITGIPLRQALATPDPQPFVTLGVPDDLPIIYVTGGSSGAERINNLILRCLNDLLPVCRIYHQTGEANKETLATEAQSLLTDKTLEARYYIHGSLPPGTVNALLSAASVVITRAGSTTLFELGVHGTPSIIIPIPEDISRDQRSNAFSYARGGGGVVLEERNLTPTLLITEIRSIMGDRNRWQKMSAAAKQFARTDAGETIVKALRHIAHEHAN